MAARSKPNVAVLCDFDGTATPHIVIDMLYHRFAAPCWLEITQRWSRGEISTQEEIQSCFATISATRAEMEAFLDSIPLDPGFPSLLDFCRRRGYRFAIVSDRLSWYIKYILDQHGIRDVTIYASEIRFEADRFRFSFPWYSPDTPLRSTSKSAIVRRYQAEDFEVVFIGDGLSDIDAVEVADVVYARNGLMEHCREQAIPAIEISNLSDVLAQWRAP